MSVLLPGIDEGIDVWKQEDSTDEQVRTTLLTPDTTCESNSCTNTEWSVSRELEAGNGQLAARWKRSACGEQSHLVICIISNC